ncbi:MAG TPA: tetratricopeptide repeat protein [Polyangia bacterium]|jgi:TolA-binding protein|nr:tetratricopeptide repeat protein [Polyangia bacterium]
MPYRLGLAMMMFALGGTIPGSSRADEVEQLGGEVLKLQEELRQLENRVQTSSVVANEEMAERLLIDAQVSYELKDYEAAAIRLLDVVEKYPQSAAYPDALFFLADSLFYKRDYFSSRRYFTQLVEQGAKAIHYQEALQRLIELSLHTGDYDPVDGYLAKLADLPPEKLRPSVPYVKGKYYFFRKNWDEVEKALKGIQPGHTYWFHSQYFVGASQVARGQLTEAVVTYEALLKAEPKTADEKRIAELAHLALGRIYYEQGQLTNANTEYSKIDLKSDLLPEALYEQAWVSIKEKDYKKAFRALDTLLTLRPDDPVAPEVKLLIGNLHIRQNEFDEARDSFTKTREEFEPLHKQLEAAQSKDIEAYFKELIGKNLGKFDATTYLPPLAVKWVRQEPEMEEVSNLVTDVGTMKKELTEAANILQRVQKALDGPQRINVFPELATARNTAGAMSARLASIERRLVNVETALESPVATPAERSQLAEIARERAKVEQQIAKLPSDTESPAARQKRIRAQFEDVDQAAVLQGAQLQTYSALRVGIEVFYANLLKDKKIQPSPAEQERAANELAAAKAEEERLRQEYEHLRQDIADVLAGVGAYDVDTQQQTQLRNQLASLIEQEHDLGNAIRGRLSGPSRARADQIASILDRARAAERQIERFGGKIDAMVEDRLKEYRSSVAEEQTHVAEYQRLLGGYEGETGDVGGGITAESFRTIAHRFYNIVVRADVGVIDVAWALKDARTQEKTRLLREQKRDLKMLDDEFKPVLKE